MVDNFCLTKLTNGKTTNFLINNWLVYCFYYMAIGHTSSFLWLTYCVTCPNHWFGVFRADHSGWRVDKSWNFFFDGLIALLYLVHSTGCELVVECFFLFFFTPIQASHAVFFNPLSCVLRFYALRSKNFLSVAFCEGTFLLSPTNSFQQIGSPMESSAWAVWNMCMWNFQIQFKLWYMKYLNFCG